MVILQLQSQDGTMMLLTTDAPTAISTIYIYTYTYRSISPLKEPCCFRGSSTAWMYLSLPSEMYETVQSASVRTSWPSRPLEPSVTWPFRGS